MLKYHIVYILVTFRSIAVSTGLLLPNNSTIVQTMIQCNNSTTKNETKIYNPCVTKINVQNQLFATFEFFVLLTSISMNLLTIIVIFNTSFLSKLVAYYFLLSFATADLGVAILITSLKFVRYLHNGSFCFDLNSCYFFVFADLLFPIASVMHLLVIAVDRSVAILLPYKYDTLFRSRNAKLIILAVWLYCVLWTSVGMFPWHSGGDKIQLYVTVNERTCFYGDKYYTLALLLSVYFVPTLITTFFYAIILKTTSKQFQAIKMHNPEKRKRRKTCYQGIKAYRTVSIVFITHTVCWMPHFIIVLLTFWDSDDNLYKFKQSNIVAYDAITTILNHILPTINSCLNPLIYFLTSKNFRRAFKQMMWRLLNERRSVLPTFVVRILEEKLKRDTCASTVNLYARKRFEDYSMNETKITGRNNGSLTPLF